MSMYNPDGEYYEIHYMGEEGGDVEFISTYRGKAMRTKTTALKCLDAVNKKHPNAIMCEIALYDESGRID